MIKKYIQSQKKLRLINNETEIIFVPIWAHPTAQNFQVEKQTLTSFLWPNSFFSFENSVKQIWATKKWNIKRTWNSKSQKKFHCDFSFSYEEQEIFSLKCQVQGLTLILKLEVKFFLNQMIWPTILKLLILRNFWL